MLYLETKIHMVDMRKSEKCQYRHLALTWMASKLTATLPRLIIFEVRTSHAKSLLYRDKHAERDSSRFQFCIRHNNLAIIIVKCDPSLARHVKIKTSGLTQSNRCYPFFLFCFLLCWILYTGMKILLKVSVDPTTCLGQMKD